MKFGPLVASSLVVLACAVSGMPSARAQSSTITPTPGVAAKHPLDGVTAIPMRMTYNPLITAFPIVYCRINGGELRPFLFDTGYSGTVLLNEDEAKRMGLQGIESNVVTKDINGATQKLKQTLVRSVEGLTTKGDYFNTNAKTVYIAKIPINNENIYPEPVAGIIGLDLFWGATLYFDFDQQTIQVIPDEHPDVATAPGAISLPCDYDGLRLRVNVSDVFGVKEFMMLDTGAVKSYFTDTIAHKFKPVSAYDAVMPGAYNSYKPTKMYFFDTIPFKNVTLKNLLIGEAGDNKAILGMDILSRFRVTIDSRREEIVLEPSATLASRNAKMLGRSGLVVGRRADGIYIVAAVKKYKDLIGSQILSIDEPFCKGKQIKALPVAQIQSLLDGYAGTSTSIAVRSSNANKNVTLTRMSVPEMYRVVKEMK